MWPKWWKSFPMTLMAFEKHLQSNCMVYSCTRYFALSNNKKDELSTALHYGVIFNAKLLPYPLSLLLFYFSEYVISSRPSVSSLVSLDSSHSLPQPLSSFKLQDSISIDDSGSVASDSASLSNSLNDPPIFQATGTDNPNDTDEPTASIEITTKSSTTKPSKKFKPPFLKSLTLSTTHIFDQFEADLTRVSHCLENNLSKYVLESNASNNIISSIDSQLADIRLMINAENNCSLLENQGTHPNGYDHNRILNEFDMRVMQIVFNQYSKASVILSIESAKNK
jgi:hypothetical protein